MAESIITNLVQYLGTLVLEEAKVLSGVTGEVKALLEELRLIKSFLRDSSAERKQYEHEIVKVLVEQIKEVAFRAEDTIETFLLNVERQQRRTTMKKVLHSAEHALMLRGVAKEIDDINNTVRQIYANKEKYHIEMGEGSMNPHLEAALRRRRNQVDHEVVGFKDVVSMISKQLTTGMSRLEVMSIVGMGGLGKTTVAKKLYNDKSIREQFTSQAWVSVSEDYNTVQVVREILKKVADSISTVERLQSEEELKEALRQKLTLTKYLIILDDVWQKDMWDEVKECFPNDGNGSRILITTRISEVALHASPIPPHYLRFLNEHESWELFEKKVFRGDPCPTYLEPIGRNIVGRCKGLPLSIVVIAGTLATQEKSERIWARTLTDVSGYLARDDVTLEILALSYHQLPVELKPCFLYFAAFPEDYEMSVRRLVSMWLTEGFIQPSGEQSFEDAAEGYLEALIDRSLVQEGTRRTDGGMKTCRIHDLVRDLCIREAERENFFLAQSKMTNYSSAKSSAALSLAKARPRRLSFLKNPARFLQAKTWDPSSVRSLMSFDAKPCILDQSQWKKLYNEYTLLRVLDLGGASTNVHDSIRDLANLRYLRICVNYVPPSIFELWNLQVLIMESTTSLLVEVALIMKLKRLQQLVLGGGSRLWASIISSLKPHINLEILSSIDPGNQVLEKLVARGLFPNLKRLGLCSSEHGFWSVASYLSALPRLHSLKIAFNCEKEMFDGIEVAEILDLTKVTIKASHLDNKSLNALAKFPNLRILKLVDVKIGDRWDEEKELVINLPKGCFPRLHTLHLVNVSESILNTDEYAMPQLRHVLVKRCNISFSDSFFELPSLEHVEVVWPRDDLAIQLERLEKENKIKYSPIIYKKH